jgi:hypothetical protein
MSRTMKSFLVLFVSLGLEIIPARADFSSSARGTTGLPLLEMPTSARAAAMGGTAAGADGSAAAISFNPAGLASVTRGDATLMHESFGEGIAYDAGAVAQRIGDRNVLSLAVRHMGFGSIGTVDNTLTSTGDTLHPQDTAGSLGYALSLGTIDLGLAATYLSSEVDNSGAAAAGSIGARLRMGSASLSLAATDFGQGPKFGIERTNLPTAFRLGSAWTPGRFTLALDGVAPRGAGPYVATGIEYRLPIGGNISFAPRAGFNSRIVSSDLGGGAGFSVGAGFGLGPVSIDYAFAPRGDIGSAQVFSLGLIWGVPPPR